MQSYISFSSLFSNSKYEFSAKSDLSNSCWKQTKGVFGISYEETRGCGQQAQIAGLPLLISSNPAPMSLHTISWRAID